MQPNDPMGQFSTNTDQNVQSIPIQQPIQTGFQPQPIAAPPASPASTSRKWLVLFAGCSVAIVLVIAGILVHLNSHTTNSEGMSSADIEAELDELEPQITAALDAEDQIFMEQGFSDAYHDAAVARSELSLRADDLEEDLQDLTEADSSKTIFTTNAALFFLSAAVILIAAIIAFLLVKK